MSIFKNLFKKEEITEIVVTSPLKGKVISLKEVNDGVFSEELLGKGCAIIPEEGKLVSPFDADVVMTFPTGHAIGLKNEMGVELLIHIGLETVNMNGDGFEVHVRQGEKVKEGDLLVSFSKEKIRNYGYNDTTMIVVSNTSNFSEVRQLCEGEVQLQQPILQIGQ